MALRLKIKLHQCPLTQRLERTNGIVRQQTGRWHRRQNKFGKLWEQTKVMLRGLYHRFGHRGASSPGEELAKTWGHTGI